MGRVNTRANDTEQRVLVSYSVPGTDEQIFAFAAALAERAVKQGCDQLYEVITPDRPDGIMTADEVRMFSLFLT